MYKILKGKVNELMKENESLKFIELTMKESKEKLLFPLNRVFSILETGYNTAFIEVGIDGRCESIGFEVLESYEEIKEKISKQFVLL